LSIWPATCLALLSCLSLTWKRKTQQRFSFFFLSTGYIRVPSCRICKNKVVFAIFSAVAPSLKKSARTHFSPSQFFVQILCYDATKGFFLFQGNPEFHTKSKTPCRSPAALVKPLDRGTISTAGLTIGCIYGCEAFPQPPAFIFCLRVCLACTWLHVYMYTPIEKLQATRLVSLQVSRFVPAEANKANTS
jgi:hypothetical protein